MRYIKIWDNYEKTIKRILFSKKLWIWIALIAYNQFLIYVLLAEEHPMEQCYETPLVPDSAKIFIAMQMAIIIFVCGCVIIYNLAMAIFYAIKKNRFSQPILHSIKIFIFMIVLILTLRFLYLESPFGEVDYCRCGRENYDKGSCCYELCSEGG